MAPTPRTCPVKDCEYSTPAALPNYDLVYKDLGMHLEYCHPSDRSSVAAPSGNSKPKPDKLPRPALKDEATEADFIFFSDSWTRYKRSTGLTGQAAVDQLWACCSQELSRSVYCMTVVSPVQLVRLSSYRQ